MSDKIMDAPFLCLLMALLKLCEHLIERLFLYASPTVALQKKKSFPDCPLQSVLVFYGGQNSDQTVMSTWRTDSLTAVYWW